MTTPTKNNSTSASLTTFPAELRAKKAWCVWQYEERGGKTTKVPYQPNGAHANAVDPATWCSFGEACAAAPAFDGVGVFNDGSYAFIDFDKCFSPDGVIEPWAQAALARIDSYAEFSPSGTGIHA